MAVARPRLALPWKLIRAHARVWGSKNPDFVLADEVLDWLKENDIAFEIAYKGGLCEDDYIEHFVVFEHSDDAFHFKLRWF